MSSTPTFDVVSQQADHVKVRLFYNTWKPKHVRSNFLKTQADAKPPFIEDVSVLVPVSCAYNRLSAYRDIFQRLIAAGHLAPTDALKKFEFREEDMSTLAYLERETICF
jgi:hypothetical protein